MPPQSRSQRRRQAARQQARPAPRAVSAEATSSAPSIGDTVPLETPVSPPPRAVRTNRRVLTRAAPEPIDYTQDYASVRTDLRWIAIWAGLLFDVMIGLYFSGLV